MKKVLLVAVLGVLLGAPQVFAAEIYKTDAVHSMVGFKVRHLGVAYVTGKFDAFDGTLTFDGDTLTAIEGTIDAKSINTANTKRDDHLRGDDFFSADKFPSITFKSTKVTQTGNTVAVVGDLTIRDVTKTVELQGETGGFVIMPEVKKTGLVLEGQINRQDFGLSFIKLLETGQAMVGNDVKLSIEIEANQPLPASKPAALQTGAQK